MRVTLTFNTCLNGTTQKRSFRENVYIKYVKAEHLSVVFPYRSAGALVTIRASLGDFLSRPPLWNMTGANATRNQYRYENR